MNEQPEKTLMFLTTDFVRARHDVLCQKAPHLQVVTELPPGEHADITAIFTYVLPAGVCSRLPNLKLVASVGAGADAILSAPDLPPKVRVTRAIEPGLGFSMAQYVVLHLLGHFRHQPALQRQQAESRWARVPVPDARRTTVGIMGLGAIGASVATAVAALGFNVVGWTRSTAPHEAVRTFSGAAQLEAFLAECQYLVCLLPLTAETRGLLDQRTLRRLPKGAYVINAARGGIVIEEDLLALVDSGHLGGAALDVFAQEPLAAESALWRHALVVVTPHVAAQPSVETVVDHFLENLRRLQSGEPLLDEVDRGKGY